MTLRDVLSHGFWRAAAHDRDRIKIAQQRLSGPHLRPRFPDRRKRVQVHDITAQRSYARQNLSRIPTDMQSHFGAERVNTVHHALFERPDKFVASQSVCPFESVKFLGVRNVWPKAPGTALAERSSRVDVCHVARTVPLRGEE